MGRDTLKILAIDVGGTKVHMAKVNTDGKRFDISGEKIFLTKDFPDFLSVLNAYKENFPADKFDALGLGMAGPVCGVRNRLTNLDWTIDRSKIGEPFGVDQVFLMNDMTVQCWGVLTASENHRMMLQVGEKQDGNIAVIAAGTGLGEGFLSFQRGAHYAHGCEGGHATFAAENDFDSLLMKHLQKKYDHVSWERVVSGCEGFRHIYDVMVSTKEIEILDVGEQLDIGSVLIKKLNEGNQAAYKVCAKFCEYYGREAGNHALKIFSTGGVYIAGGLGPRMPELMKKYFVKAFLQKGRFVKILSDMPVYMITDPQAALKGAALGAFTQMTEI